tara:strand:+ start:392 stop:706 length:315 start_codon:yes stop_codon:yes gene_type:complete
MEEDFKLKAIFNLYRVGGEHKVALGTLQIDKEGSLVDLTSQEQTEVDAEVIRLQAEYDSQLYARNRKEEYDQLNQFELISDDSINGTTTHKDAILAIKAEFPKP